nr:hypothetical protein [Mixta theicola]
MEKVRIKSVCTVASQDDLWFVVTQDKEGNVVYPKNSDDPFGYGNITYSGDARRYDFRLYWLDDGMAGTDWTDKKDKACELAILAKRLAAGDVFTYTDKKGIWNCRITSITAVI